MDLRQIYEKLKQQAEKSGQPIDDNRLRQQAQQFISAPCRQFWLAAVMCRFSS